MTYIVKINDGHINPHVIDIESEEEYQKRLKEWKLHLNELVYTIERSGPSPGSWRYIFINRALEKKIDINVKAEPTEQELLCLTC